MFKFQYCADTRSAKGRDCRVPAGALLNLTSSAQQVEHIEHAEQAVHFEHARKPDQSDAELNGHAQSGVTSVPNYNYQPECTLQCDLSLAMEEDSGNQSNCSLQNYDPNLIMEHESVISLLGAVHNCRHFPL